jgi:hypothetical protein
MIVLMSVFRGPSTPSVGLFLSTANARSVFLFLPEKDEDFVRIGARPAEERVSQMSDSGSLRGVEHDPEEREEEQGDQKDRDVQLGSHG